MENVLTLLDRDQRRDIIRGLAVSIMQPRQFVFLPHASKEDGKKVTNGERAKVRVARFLFVELIGEGKILCSLYHFSFSGDFSLTQICDS